MKLYTLGYQGLALPDYLRVLREAEVKLVIDVRDHAWSQRPAYVKSALRDELSRAGISYVHAPSVGNPAYIRKRARSAATCLRQYRDYINEHCEALHALNRLTVENRLSGVCLTCFERDPLMCHRSVLSELLLQLNRKLKIVHLPSPIQRGVIAESARVKSLTTSAFLQPALLP
jgi:uncharacterized protein (DUF488 family)